MGGSYRACLLAAGCGAIVALALEFARPPIRFVREEVTLAVGRDHAEVHGAYVFANPGDRPVTITLFYPIPRGHGLGPAEFCLAWEVRDGQRRPLPLASNGDRYLFGLALPPRSEATVEVHYRQPLSAPRARYILRTTWLWLRPLEESILHVVADGELGVIETNYAMEFQAAADGRSRFRMVRQNWLSLADLEAQWGGRS